jgi:enoyl-CoA hydratase/carnithine racemase
MGGGMGLAQGASPRVATTRTKIAMPETRIGLLPDVGATRFMSRMDARLELFVGLTEPPRESWTLGGASASGIP